MTFTQLIFGTQKIETGSQKRKLLLTAYLLLVYLGIQIYFLIVSQFNPNSDSSFLFAGNIVSIICLLFLRWGWVDISIVIHLIGASATTFYFCAIEQNPYETATYLYFLGSSIGALAIFGYRERWKGISYTSLNFLLFLIAYFNKVTFTPTHPHFYLISNFSIILVLGGVIVLFFDWLSIQSELKILNKNNELQKLNAELDSFVYRASHDLRSPLSSILGLADIASKTTDVDEMRMCIDMIKTRVHVQDNFIKDIIDYSRNSRVDVKPETIQLKEFVYTIVETLIFNEGAKEIKYEVEIPTNFVVIADKTRLRVVLSNLISNAIKYRDTKKDHKYIKIGALKYPTQVDIFVEDNGIGIADESQGKIFTMFYRGTEHSKGSGLGLFIAKEAVVKTGGSIRFKSTFGEGTTFLFSVPMKIKSSFF